LRYNFRFGTREQIWIRWFPKVQVIHDCGGHTRHPNWGRKNLLSVESLARVGCRARARATRENGPCPCSAGVCAGGRPPPSYCSASCRLRRSPRRRARHLPLFRGRPVGARVRPLKPARGCRQPRGPAEGRHGPPLGPRRPRPPPRR
jgi:hypothetical protein